MDPKQRSAQQPIVQMMQGKHVQKKFKAEIILGSPSSGCQGVGICKVMAHGDKRVFKCRKVSAWIMVVKDECLRMSFWKSEMDSRFVKRHFGWMLFQVFEPYKLPVDIANSLGLDRAEVRPGIYNVWETSRFLMVDFEIAHNELSANAPQKI